MTQRDWFTLAVRLLGLFFVYQALASVLAVIVSLFATIGAPMRGAPISMIWFVQLILYVLLALYFLRGAPHLVGFAFRGRGD